MNENFEYKPITKGLGFHKKSTFIQSKNIGEDLQSIDHPLPENSPTQVEKKPPQNKPEKLQSNFNFPQYQHHLGTRPKSQIEFSVEKNIFEIEKKEVSKKNLTSPKTDKSLFLATRFISFSFDVLLSLFVWFTCLALLIYFFHIPLNESKTWIVLASLFLGSAYCFRCVVVLLLNKTFGEILTNLELRDLKTKSQIDNFKAFIRANLALVNLSLLLLPGLLINLVTHKSLDECLGVYINRNNEWQSKASAKNSSKT